LVFEGGGEAAKFKFGRGMGRIGDAIFAILKILTQFLFQSFQNLNTMLLVMYL
jgi:hypothetical protein